jgi:putative endonuclease
MPRQAGTIVHSPAEFRAGGLPDDAFMSRQVTGRIAERLAAEYLAAHGFQIIGTNWRCPEGEIDIICRNNDNLVFVEVRAKSTPDFGSPAESVSLRKRKKLIAAAQSYLSTLAEEPAEWRIDFIGIEFGDDGHKLEHIPHAVLDVE